MKWWRCKGKKNQGWLYFRCLDNEGPHTVAQAVLGPLAALEPVDEVPKLDRLGLAGHGIHKLELFIEGTQSQ